jgi:hypothetical protein
MRRPYWSFISFLLAHLILTLPLFATAQASANSSKPMTDDDVLRLVELVAAQLIRL